jgi:YVTN family beta-propeller protein
MIVRLTRVMGAVFAVAAALALPVVVTSTPASADTVVDGCTIVSNPTPTHFTDCPNAGLGGASLSGLNLSYADLAGSEFVACHNGSPPSCFGADLTDTNLTDANLTGVGVYGEDIERNPILQVASAWADFSGANLSGANLSGTNFGGAKFSDANFTGANLTGAAMSFVDQLTGITIPATLTGATLTGTILVPPSQTVTATSSAGAVATWSTPPGIVGASPGSCSQASGSTFPLFSTSVTCQVFDGNGDSATGTFRVTVSPTTQFFTRLLVPANGAVLSGTQSLDAGASDAPGITKVEFELSGGTQHNTVIATATPTYVGWLAAWDTTTVPDNTYTMQSLAFDAAGHVSQSTPVTVHVDNHPPTTAVLIPSNGTTLSGSQVLDASASGTAGVTKVEFQITGGALKGKVVATASPTIYGWLASWNTTGVFNGTYSLQSLAFGPSGVATVSAAVSITVQNTQPATTVLTPSNGATVTGSTPLDASAAAGTTKVTFELSGGSFNDQVVATATPTIYGWLAAWDTTTVANGTYTLNSVAYDATSDSSTSTGITLTVDNVPTPTAFVVNNGDNTVTPISLASYTAGTPIAAGNGADAIAVAPGGARAYVVDLGSSSVTPINTENDTAGPQIAVGADPFAIAITPNGATAYVVNNGDNTVTPINLATNTAGTPIAVGSFPDSIAITPDGSTAYVTNPGDNTVTPINTSTNTAGPPIVVGSGPQHVAITPDGDTAYVANLGGTITPIDTATNTAGAAISVGSNPSIVISPNGATAYVLSGSNTLTPIDTATNVAGAPISVGPASVSLSRGVFTPDGSTFYVGTSNTNSVFPIDVATNAVGDGIGVGISPEYLAASPDGTTVYVVNNGGNSVSPINTTTNTAGAAIPVGKNPVAIAIS